MVAQINLQLFAKKDEQPIAMHPKVKTSLSVVESPYGPDKTLQKWPHGPCKCNEPAFQCIFFSGGKYPMRVYLQTKLSEGLAAIILMTFVATSYMEY